MLIFQKIWAYSTGLIIPRTVNIFTGVSSVSNHSSIQMFKDKYQNSFNFKFEPVSTDQFIKFTDEIGCKKVQVEIYQQHFFKMHKEKLQNQ